MNFTKIEIIGFKSFANKTEIRFDHGVTGIVGPNGCGKSNVADAIRWVLGEQSAKQLRGSSMQDVIFSGTQNRKSLSYCEVSLFFDNSTGIFKSEEYTEVILTRKLYRNGDSEFYINKKPRRLKDIVNLLHECGLSKEGYTIIGQNKVTEILSSKPEDRRAIFEEAVGISKTKAQRLEAERKLQKTQDNIIRFSDICMNLESQLAPLSREAEVARTYNTLSEELKIHEVNAYLYKFENAADEKAKIQARLQVVSDELDVKVADLDATEKLYSSSMNSFSVADEQIKVLNDAILEKTVGLEEQKGNVKVYKQKLEFFDNEINRLKEENQTNQDKINSSAGVLSEKKSFAIKAENELQSLISKSEQLSSRLVSVITEINEGESVAKAETNKVIAAIQGLSDMKSNISSLEAEKSVLLEHKNETAAKTDALKVKLASTQNERAKFYTDLTKANKDVESITDEIEASENGVKITNEKIAELSTKIFSLSNSITTLEASERFYNGLKESYEGYPEAVRRLMLDAKEDSKLNSKIKGVVASILHTDKQYETAIEFSMGNALQHIVTANETDASYILNYIKMNNYGRATCLPVTTVKYRMDSAEVLDACKERGAINMAAKLVRYDKYYEPIIRFLLGNTLVCDNLDNALRIARKYHFAFKIVTLDGEIFSPQGTMTGGSKRQASNMLSVDGKVESIKKDLVALRADYEALNKKKNHYLSTLSGLNDDLSTLKNQFNEKKQEILVLKEKIAQSDLLITETESEVETYREALKILNTRIDELTRRYSDMEEGRQSLKQKSQASESDKEQKEAYFEKLKAERDKLITENTECQSKLATLKAEIAANKVDIERLTEEISVLRSLIRDNDKNIVNDNDIVNKLKSDMEQIVLSNEEQQVVNELRERLKKAEERKEYLQATIETSNTRRQELNTKISELTSEKLKEQFNLEKVDTDLGYAGDKLMENYELTYEDCLQLRQENYDIKTSHSSIEKLKRKINSLGPINNKAIESYQDINEIYQDNILQKQDLEKGAEDLRKGIQNLTEEMTSKFNTGFEIIRSNFRKIFKELFGGGTADLLLDYDNCDDPLEAGVEIFAEPPGKKLTNIRLLSGGEMALTAIAILFAILRLCPMPFCVLDEIEAALDEANVERFARYLKNFSAETQFIIITHKKVTMELADALYGVTMQEKGVSSIVSVELADVNLNELN